MNVPNPLARMIKRLLVRLGVVLNRLDGEIARASLPQFATNPKSLTIQHPSRFNNPDRIHLGDDVKIGPNSVLSANTQYPGGWLHHPKGQHVSQQFTPTLEIGDRVTATGALQIYALDRITIEDDVMFATNVFICDGLHGYETADVPYKYQGMTRIAPIRIGYGSWIGQNVVIMPGVTIGRLAIVGANSVVTKAIPAQCIAMGTPARIVKRWSDEQATWENSIGR